MVEVGEGADLIRYFKVFHVVNLSPREHVGGLDGALTHFLVDNRLVNFLFDRVWQGRLALIRISLVGVLISAFTNHAVTKYLLTYEWHAYQSAGNTRRRSG